MDERSHSNDIVGLQPKLSRSPARIACSASPAARTPPSLGVTIDAWLEPEHRRPRSAFSVPSTRLARVRRLPDTLFRPQPTAARRLLNKHAGP